MRVTQRVKKLLSSYETDNPGTKSGLARILMEGKLAGTGRAMILPIDHGFTKELVPQFAGTNSEYHFQLAVDAGLSAICGPIDMLQSGADDYAGSIPLILQMQVGDAFTSSNTLNVTGAIRDAVRLGCVGIGFAVADHHETDHVRALIEEAKSHGLAVMLWVSALTSAGAIDHNVEGVSQVAQNAATLGAHLIAVRMPRKSADVPLSDRIRQTSRACNHRMLVFASGSLEDDDDLFDEVRGIRDGGANGYVLPSNCLYRPYEEALSMLDKSMNIYLGKV